MKKDIKNQKVEDLAIAIVPRSAEIIEKEMWDTFLINLKEESIANVLISSKGYGEIGGEDRKTTTLRHFFDEIGPLAIQLIEPIDINLFELTNEYWVSFTFNGHMFDKRYIFVRGSISEENFTPIPFLGRKGVMIR